MNELCFLGCISFLCSIYFFWILEHFYEIEVGDEKKIHYLLLNDAFDTNFIFRGNITGTFCCCLSW